MAGLNTMVTNLGGEVRLVRRPQSCDRVIAKWPEAGLIEARSMLADARWCDLRKCTIYFVPGILQLEGPISREGYFARIKAIGAFTRRVRDYLAGSAAS
jgi:hypothetical protein